jgi:PAS domain S-box-containing protein
MSDRDEKAEGALWESEARYRALFESEFFSVYLHDLEGRFLEANDTALRLLGYTRNEIRSLSFASLLHPDQLPEAVRVFEEIVETGSQSKPAVYKLEARNGDSVWLETDGRLISRGGKPFAIQGVARDITESKRTLEELAHKEKRFRDIAENALEWIWEVDREGKYTYASAAVEKILGYTPEEVLEKHFYDFFHPEEREESKKVAFDVVARKEAFRQFENRNVNKNGELVWLSTIGVPILDDQGSLLGYRGADTDISERKRAEEVLRESEARYRLLADNATDVIWVMSLNLAPIYLSPSIERLQGFSVEEALARSIDELLSADSVALATKTLAEEFLIEAGEHKDLSRSRRLELELKCRDGSTVWAEVSVRFVRDECGKAISLLGISRDISERRRAEEEKAALEEQLRHAQKMEAIGTLASGIAHDFNNLLTGILGHAELLKLETRPGDDVFKAADVIERAAERASALTRQLLGFAQKGKQRSIPVDMDRVIGDVIALLSHSVDRRIDISHRCNADPPVVMGDPSQLHQVIMNLAINATDAMSEGGEIVIDTTTVELDEQHCRVFPEVPPGRYSVISVADSGIGISEDVRDHVFEPFFTTKERSEGTGMGLAMVYGIVKNHAGVIRVHSEVGVGTRFEVYLPVAEGGPASREESPAKVPVRGKERILFVDDEEVVRKATARMLASLGYTVTCATNGEEGVAYYSEHMEEIDLVILDITMPGMDGGDCFRALKKIAPDVKAVLTSGHALDGTAQRLMEEGMLGFVQKPYLSRELSEAVSTALGT